MNRTKFVAAFAALIAAPAFSFSVLKTSIRGYVRGFKIAAGEGRIHGHLKLKGVNQNILDVKISGSDTDGCLALFEQTSLSQGKGTPLHVHDAQDEIFYVMNGAYYFQVGEDKYNLTAGDSIFLPRKVPHAWTQISEKGKMMVVLQPAGKLEDFFVTMSNIQHEPSSAEIAKIFSENGMKIVGQPLKLE